MSKKKSDFSFVRIVFITIISLLINGSCQAGIDPHSFCNNTCKPDLCRKEPKVKSHCQKVCGGIVNQIAVRQLKELNKGLPVSSVPRGQGNENNQLNTQAFSQTDIYQCLEILHKPDPAPLPKKQSPEKINICASALQVEKEAHDQKRNDFAESVEALGKF